MALYPALATLPSEEGAQRTRLMPATEQFDEIRHQIVQLLREQLEALSDISDLTDAQLAACYRRQDRVRLLRDELLQAGDRKAEHPTLGEQGPTSLPGNPESAIAGI